jgi:hypothetical protein
MRDAADSVELLRLARAEESEGVTFCSPCAELLRSIVVGHHFGQN